MNRMIFPLLFLLFIIGLYFIGFADFYASKVEVVLEKEKVQKYELIGLTQTMEKLQEEKQTIEKTLKRLDERKDMIAQQRDYMNLVKGEAVRAISFSQNVQKMRLDKEHLISRKNELMKIQELYQ